MVLLLYVGAGREELGGEGGGTGPYASGAPRALAATCSLSRSSDESRPNREVCWELHALGAAVPRAARSIGEEEERRSRSFS